MNYTGHNVQPLFWLCIWERRKADLVLKDKCRECWVLPPYCSYGNQITTLITEAFITTRTSCHSRTKRKKGGEREGERKYGQKKYKAVAVKWSNKSRRMRFCSPGADYSLEVNGTCSLGNRSPEGFVWQQTTQINKWEKRTERQTEGTKMKWIS